MKPRHSSEADGDAFDRVGLEQAQPKLVVADLSAEQELAAACAEALARATITL